MLRLRISEKQAADLAVDGVLAIAPDLSATSGRTLTVHVEVESLARTCLDCGRAVVPDCSAGVWLHDPDWCESISAIDTDHAARPHEDTAHPAEQPEAVLAVYYDGPRYALNEPALARWLAGEARGRPWVPSPSDPEGGSAAARLFEEAQARGAIVGPASLDAQIYADDDQNGAVLFSSSFRAATLRRPRHRPAASPAAGMTSR
jgi:hypothetical protein